MGRKSAQCSEEAKVEILAEQKKSHPPHIYRRLLALKFKAVDGMLSKEAGRITGLHETSVNRIVNRYQKEGIPYHLNGVQFRYVGQQWAQLNVLGYYHGRRAMPGCIVQEQKNGVIRIRLGEF